MYFYFFTSWRHKVKERINSNSKIYFFLWSLRFVFSTWWHFDFLKKVLVPWLKWILVKINCGCTAAVAQNKGVVSSLCCSSESYREAAEFCMGCKAMGKDFCTPCIHFLHSDFSRFKEWISAVKETSMAVWWGMVGNFLGLSGYVGTKNNLPFFALLNWNPSFSFKLLICLFFEKYIITFWASAVLFIF